MCVEELRLLRESAASERQKRKEAEALLQRLFLCSAEALGRERLEDMRRDLQQTRQELEELREDQ